MAKDPGYGLAYSGFAYYYILRDDWYLPPNESATRAKSAAQKALQIDDKEQTFAWLEMECMRTHSIATYCGGWACRNS